MTSDHRTSETSISDSLDNQMMGLPSPFGGRLYFLTTIWITYSDGNPKIPDLLKRHKSTLVYRVKLLIYRNILKLHSLLHRSYTMHHTTYYTSYFTKYYTDFIQSYQVPALWR